MQLITKTITHRMSTYKLKNKTKRLVLHCRNICLIMKLSAPEFSRPWAFWRRSLTNYLPEFKSTSHWTLLGYLAARIQHVWETWRQIIASLLRWFQLGRLLNDLWVITVLNCLVYVNFISINVSLQSGDKVSYSLPPPFLSTIFVISRFGLNELVYIYLTLGFVMCSKLFAEPFISNVLRDKIVRYKLDSK